MKKILISLRRFLLQSIINVMQLLSPARVLRVLFYLEHWLYYFEGQMAVAYGNGIHTKHRHTHFHDFFIGRIAADDRVLDIGCGIGAVAHNVAERANVSVVGIDLNPHHIAQAQRLFAHPRVQYRVGDALEALPDEHFTIVILSNVLEHLPNRSEFLRRVQETIHPARILIRVPLFERDWRVPLKRELGVEWRLDKTHETEYTLETFAAEISAAGLTIAYQEVRWGEIWAEVRASDDKQDG